jgi:hypothetical protein
VTCVVHVPYVLEQDGEGVWCASAQLSRLGVKLMVLDRPVREEANDMVRDNDRGTVVT